MSINTAILLFALPLTAMAADPVYVPVQDKDGTLYVRITKTNFKPVERQIQVIENGVRVTKKVTEKVAFTVEVNQPLDATAGDFFDPAGNRLDPKKLRGILKAGSIVALSSDGKPIDAEVLKKNKEVVAILVPKNADLPKDPRPETKPATSDKPFVTEAWVTDGTINFKQLTTAYVQEQRVEQRRTPDGKVIAVTVTVMVPVTRETTATLDPKKTLVQTPDGKAVDSSEWAKLLKEKTKVIVSPTGKPVPEEYLKSHKEARFVVLMNKGK